MFELLDNVTFAANSTYIPIAGYQLDIIITLLSIIAGCELIHTINMLGQWSIKSLGKR